MPTDQPNNTADENDLPAPDARDDRTAAAVLADGQRDDPPAGGGLGGAAAATGSARATRGAAPNSPLADAMVAGHSDIDAEKEARTRVDRSSPDESHPPSV